MNKYIPLKKQQKKLQRKENAKHRNGWNGLNPVTRKPPNPSAYDRRAAAAILRRIRKNNFVE